MCCEWITKCVCAVLTFIVNLIIIVCIVSLIVWAMLRGNAVQFQVQDAELIRFSLDPDITNNNLHYNLSINFSIRNSKSRLGIHYDSFEAMAYYHHHRFAAVSMPLFYQGHKSTVVVRTVFEGHNLVFLGNDGRRIFEDDRKAGAYGVDVELKLTTRFMYGLVNTWRFKPRVHCWLNLKLGASDSSKGFGFQSTNCRIHFWDFFSHCLVLALNHFFFLRLN